MGEEKGEGMGGVGEGRGDGRVGGKWEGSEWWERVGLGRGGVSKVVG